LLQRVAATGFILTLNRFTIFALQQALADIAAWASMRLGSVLMEAYDIYIPLVIGVGAIVIIIILVLCMNETPMQDDQDSNLPSQLNVKDRLWKIFDCLRISWSVRLLVLTFLVSGAFAQFTADGSVFQQYISKHFGRTIAKVRATSRPD
jgi:hypothetical protein